MSTCLSSCHTPGPHVRLCHGTPCAKLVNTASLLPALCVTADLKCLQVHALRTWVLTAHADLILAEALSRTSLSPQQELAVAVEAAVELTADGPPQLRRPASPTFLQGMRGALAAASTASPRLHGICDAIVQQACTRVDLLERVRVRSLPPTHL